MWNLVAWPDVAIVAPSNSVFVTSREQKIKRKNYSGDTGGKLQTILELTVHTGFAKEAASRIKLESNHRVFETAIHMGRFKSLKKNEIVCRDSVDAVTLEGDRTLAKFAFNV